MKKIGFSIRDKYIPWVHTIKSWHQSDATLAPIQLFHTLQPTSTENFLGLFYLSIYPQAIGLVDMGISLVLDTSVKPP